MAAADSHTANRMPGDNFDMFSILNASASVIADMPMVNAMEHNGPAIGMEPNTSPATFWMTPKIHTSYWYGVPMHVRSINVNPEIVPEHVSKIDVPAEGDPGAVGNGREPPVDISRPEEVDELLARHLRLIQPAHLPSCASSVEAPGMHRCPIL